MARKSNQKLRQIPAVSSILERDDIKPLFEKWSFAYVSHVVKAVIENGRKQAKKSGGFLTADQIAERVIGDFESKRAFFIQPVINATGVVLHTNLGRSPIGTDIMGKVMEIASGYCNLEFDLLTGLRSKRGELAGEMAAVLAGTEAGLVVNNCAAAIMLIVNAFARNREVVVSRGELIQIGGGFRIPDVVEASAARLREIGTTNRTGLNDYRRAIGGDTGLVLKVHRSNFAQIGFVSEAAASDVAAIARKNKVVSLYDLGSGMHTDFGRKELKVEPEIRSAVKTGVDLVCFSGDKLLGGPQAGIIVGKRKLIERLNKHPLYRPVRPDKLCLCALEQTLYSYIIGNENIGIGKIMSNSLDSLRNRALRICDELLGLPIKPAPLKSAAGGGSTPLAKIESFGINVTEVVDGLDDALRRWNPPIIARNNKGKITIDLMTVFPDQDVEIIRALKACT